MKTKGQKQMFDLIVKLLCSAVPALLQQGSVHHHSLTGLLDFGSILATGLKTQIHMSMFILQSETTLQTYYVLHMYELSSYVKVVRNTEVLLLQRVFCFWHQ